MELFNQNGAIFSEDRKYRFVLWRIWNDELPKVMFIGLNPSTANEDKNDPTIRRIISLSRNLGFGGVYMLNLFTFVTPHPEELKKCENPLKLADYYLSEYGNKSNLIVAAWGTFPEVQDRSKHIMAMFPNLHCLALNQNGSPRHPLYVPNNINLKKLVWKD